MLYKSTELVHKIQQELREEIQDQNLKPHVAVLVVGKDAATKSFITIKKKFAQSLHIPFDEYYFDESITTQELIREIEQISTDAKVTALIVQLPLPKSINKDLVLESIPKRLDVDVLNSETYRTFVKSNKPLPPVAGAVMDILRSLDISFKDKAIAVVGVGALVGKPVYY
jgi:methylenetetrahydrofolate dehydrogenase (NADP+)/methenyltetrahydrofolate cyclohydrolase